MAYTIKYMGLGGILDQAIAVVKDHFVLLFTIMLFGFIPLALAQGFLQHAVTTPLPPNATMEERIRAQREAEIYTPIFLGITIVNVVFVAQLSTIAVIHALSRVYLGEPVTVKESFKHAFRRFLPYWGTNILVALTLMGGVLLLIVGFFVFAVWFGLAAYVVVIEESSGTTAMSRSKKLVIKDWTTYIALALIVSVISGMVQLGAAFIPQPHLQVLTTAMVQAVMTVFWAAAFVIFYYSCRCRVDNFDLHYLAQSIGPEQPKIGEGAFAPGV